MDVLLPDPLTFGFKLVRDESDSDNLDPVKESDLPESPASKSSVLAHEMTSMVVVVRNNTKDTIKINLNITCRDVAGENCVDGTKSTVLWTGVLSEITVEIPPLHQIKHSFCLHFLVPGEYTLLAAAVIDDANDILRARARATSSAEPIFCRGPPYHLRVLGNT
ncbi:putative TRAPP II complex, Trs120 protein [Medicago truncatula]|uniref:Putative TRAPP II complex, Trs120 protein n=1 Tax=Medicago truncatula TaxID=3880 RepID=A0A396H5Q6_MEDTR|nr:putative TRAPP II complex, Trs120 protein [Medicago truncatula]